MQEGTVSYYDAVYMSALLSIVFLFLLTQALLFVFFFLGNYKILFCVSSDISLIRLLIPYKEV